MTSAYKIRPLCLSFWAPPVLRPQSILIGKMIPEWIRQGLKPVIISYDNGDWDINAPVYKISEFSAKNQFQSLPIIRNIREWLYYEKAYRLAKKIIKKHDLNIVFSFSNPQASNIIGAMLKKRLGIKFVSHFCDPWYDNPYKKYTGRGGLKVKTLEAFIVKWSDKIIFTNDAATKLVMKKYPEEIRKRALDIPHCYDKRDYSEIKNNNEKFTISHIGTFYDERNPELLFRALKPIIENFPALKNKFILRIIGGTSAYAGYTDEKLNNMIEKYGIQEIVNTTPPVPYKESLALMKQADFLVVIDANFKNSPFLPSKVVDYAGTGRPVVGITPNDSPTAKILKKLGSKSFNYDQEKELADYLKKLIAGEVQAEINSDEAGKFDVKETTAKLIGIFEKILSD
ncbi:MAG: glycosyltransferase [Candidatus Paceibacterota bacterium]